MRYCSHRDQYPWRCVTPRQDKSAHPSRFESTAKESQRSARKVSVKSAGLSHHISVKTGVHLESMPVRKRLRQQYPALTILVSKLDSCQLYYPVFTTEQWPRNSSSLHTTPQKLVACTSLPLTEEEPEKSASLSFQCNHLQRPAQHCTVCANKLREFEPQRRSTLVSAEH